jgi:hypothetical protein
MEKVQKNQKQTNHGLSSITIFANGSVKLHGYDLQDVIKYDDNEKVDWNLASLKIIPVQHNLTEKIVSFNNTKLFSFSELLLHENNATKTPTFHFFHCVLLQHFNNSEYGDFIPKISIHMTGSS